MAFLAAYVLRFAWTRQYSLDEFDYAHLAWLVSTGAVPYRDFFDHHFPFLYQLFAGILRLAGDSPESIRWLRCAMLPSVAAVGWAVWSLNRRTIGRLWAGIALLVLFTNPTFLQFATEVRPDGLALALVLSSVAVLERRVPGAHPRQVLFAGLLLGAAMWTSSKVLVYGSPLGLLFVSDLFGSSDPRWKRALRSPWLFLAGLLLVVATAVAYLWTTGSLDAFVRFCFQWSAAHEQAGRRFSWWQYLAPVATRFSWWFLAAGIGVVATVQRCWRQRRWRTRQAALLLILVTSFVSYAVQSAPYPYSLLPFLAMVGIFAGRGFAAIGRRLRRHLSRTSSRLVAAAAAILWLLTAVPPLELELRRDNGYQHQVLAEIDRLVAPDDRVYANSGSFVTRRGIGFFPYTNAFIRQVEAEVLAEELPRALVAEGCVAMLIDTRFSTLPDALRSFLLSHFAPYNSDLWLWGASYPTALGPSWRSTFLASAAGEYFVSPPGALAAATLTIDGAAVGETFVLGSGPHALGYDGPPQDLAILWLPTNGERYSPGLTGEPRFSRLF